VKLAYRRASGEFVYYEPTEQDAAFHHKLEQGDTMILKFKKSILRPQLKQLPYLFAIYIGCFFLTFLIGSLWVAFKKRPLLS